MAASTYIPLVTELDDTFMCLESLPGSLRQIQFTVAHLQCHFLELTAWLDYAFTYLPIMVGNASSPNFLANIISTFISPGPVAQQLLCAGIPVWITTPFRFLPLIWIDVLVEPCRANRYAVQADVSPPFNTFFVRSSISLDKYKAYDHVRWLCCAHNHYTKRSHN